VGGHNRYRITMHRRRCAPWRHSRHGLVLLGVIAVAGSLLAITPARLGVGTGVWPLLWGLLLVAPLTYRRLSGGHGRQDEPALATRAGRRLHNMPRGSYDA